MAEKMHLDNIKYISELFNSGKISELETNIIQSQNSAKKLRAKLEEKIASFNEKEKQEAIVEEPVKVEEAKGATFESVKEVEALEEAVETVSVIEREAETKETVTKTEQAPIEKPAEKTLPSFIVRRKEFVPSPQKEFSPKKEFKPYESGNNRPPRQDRGDKDKQPRNDFNKGGFNKKPQSMAPVVAPEIIPNSDKRGFNNKKKANNDRQYEEKHTVNAVRIHYLISGDTVFGL